MNRDRPMPVQSFNRTDYRVEFKLPWWIKISTSHPKCVYYFGSFDNKLEAVEALPGYIEDLEAEQARGIFAEIKQDCPQQLTIYAE
jgi:hypothetical protein